jgi:hypothetical protein
MGKRWVPLESDPEVLNKFAETIGAPSDYKFCDVFGMDEVCAAEAGSVKWPDCSGRGHVCYRVQQH